MKASFGAGLFLWIQIVLASGSRHVLWSTFSFEFNLKSVTIEVFTNSLEYKNDNIANFVLALSWEKNNINEICNLKM